MWWLGMTAAVLGGGLLWRLHRRRQRLEYPEPRSLILPLDASAFQTRDPDAPPQTSWYADRMVAVDGVRNFRDLGGYRTADGRLVRRGLVYRSGSLAGVTAEGLRQLGDLNIKLVCDLRSPQETLDAPDRLPDTAVYLHLPLDARDDSWRRLRALLFNRHELARMLPEFYIQIMLVRNARLYGGLLRRLADAGNLPAVLHCTAGKDRTGMAVALLLLALGVPEAAVLADYSVSNLYYDTYLAYAAGYMQRLAFLGLRGDDLKPMLLADPATLQAALDFLRQEYGSLSSYLRDAAGVDEGIIEKLRANLLE